MRVIGDLLLSGPFLFCMFLNFFFFYLAPFNKLVNDPSCWAVLDCNIGPRSTQGQYCLACPLRLARKRLMIFYHYFFTKAYAVLNSSISANCPILSYANYIRNTKGITCQQSKLHKYGLLILVLHLISDQYDVMQLSNGLYTKKIKNCQT